MTRSYYPALLVGWLTPAYDLFVRMLLRERQFKCQLIASARIAPGQRVLDVGAGTGTLAINDQAGSPECGGHRSRRRSSGLGNRTARGVSGSRRFELITDNLAGLLLEMLREAGFLDVGETTRVATALGTLSILHGRKPS